MTDYRKAKCIELHDSNIALTTNDESYAFTAPVGRSVESDKPAFCIQLRDIAMLAEMFNIKTLKKVSVPILSRQHSDSSKHEEIDFLEIPIFRKQFSPSDEQLDDEKITQLECQLLSDRLINIKITSKNEEIPEPFIENMTYCGNFTIWWE